MKTKPLNETAVQVTTDANKTRALQLDTKEIATAEQARAIAEVQAQVILAKQFPRQMDTVHKAVVSLCNIPALAEKACYAYPRGKNEDGTPNIVEGPSIRLVEAIAQAMGNMLNGFKIAEENTREGYSRVVTYSWDMETGMRWESEFKVALKRKALGKYYVLTDPRDMYELTANQASRRLRACILRNIPVWLQEEAVATAKKTLAKDSGNVATRMQRAVKLFKSFGVTEEMLSEYIGAPVADFTPEHVTGLINVYNTLKDNAAKVSDFFNVPYSAEQETTESTLNEELDTGAGV